MAELSKNPTSYSVFYAIYMCETLMKRERPDLDWDQLQQHNLQFRPYEHYIYSPRNLKRFEHDGETMKFAISFLGLYGVDSPLPRCYHDEVPLQQRAHGKGKVPLQNFLDIFNNRFYWLYYQAWKKYRFYLHLNDESDNKVAQQISAFIGQGVQSRDAKRPVPQYKLLQLSGVLSHRVRSKEGLLIVLREFFSKFSVDIREFVPSRVRVEGRPLMGRKYGADSMRLGVHCLLGQWVTDYTSRICIVVGPMSFDDFLEFLPGGRSARLLRYLLRLYLNDSLEYDVQLQVESDGVRKIHWQDKRLKLGQSLWLGKPREPRLEKYIRYEEYAHHQHAA